MRYELSQKFYFEAAHTLRREIDAESSRRVHGHTYHAEVVVAGSPDAISGMVMDIERVRREVNRVRGLLDHRLLDDVDGLGPATMENLCAYIVNHIGLRDVVRVSVSRPASGDACTLIVEA